MTASAKIGLVNAGIGAAWFLAAFAVFGPLLLVPGCATGSSPAPQAAGIATSMGETPDSVARLVPMRVFPAGPDCGRQDWFTVEKLTPTSAGIRMAPHPHIAEPIVGYWFGLGPWQANATWEAWPGGPPPPGWTIGNLGPLPGDLPWHFKIVEVAAGPDQNGDGFPDPLVVGCAEVSFQIPQGARR